MINQTMIAQRIEQFDAKHSEGGEPVSDTGWIYYPDGAKRETNPHGALCEPSKRPQERLRTVAHYHRLVMERAVREFDTAKQRIKQNPVTHPNLEENVRVLKDLRRAARHAAVEHEDVLEELRRVSPGYRTPDEERLLQQQLAQRAAERAEYESAIDAITI